eukprot:5185414-Alexandrium_andersonii.AAC.1
MGAKGSRKRMATPEEAERLPEGPTTVAAGSMTAFQPARRRNAETAGIPLRGTRNSWRQRT